MFHFSQYLSKHQFCILLEYLTISQDTAVPKSLAGYSVVTTLADRVHADDDLAPLELAKSFPSHIEKLLHYSGKGRDIQDFEMFLQQAQTAKIQNLLLLTGDKLKNHCDGCDGSSRTRYLESVNAVMAAKKHGGFHIGIAFNPYKYVEAEKDAQYLKLHKKIKAGADYIITQLGYDLNALRATQAFLQQYQYPQSLLACVMPILC